MEKKLYRDDQRKAIGGVCAGVADYFSMDVTIVRLIFVLMLILHGMGLVVYFVLWIVLPRKTFSFSNPTVDYKVPPQAQQANTTQGNPFQSNTFGSSPFSNQTFPNQPFPGQQRSTSLVGIVFGVILIVAGGSYLLNDFDIIPDWDFGQLWPIMLIAVGVTLIFAGEKKKPWEQANWHKTEVKEDAKTMNDASEKQSDDAAPPADNTHAV